MDDESAAGLSPAEAFALVGHEHRVDILRSLLFASREFDEYPTPFARLQDLTDIEVSSQFSYHLDALTGQFVRQTEEGYELRYAGWEIATSILAGTYNQRAEFGPEQIDGICPLCEASDLVTSYDEEWLTIECSNCDARHSRYPLPPGAIQGRSTSELLRMFDQHVRSHMRLARAGVCPGCTGVMEVETDPDDECVHANRSVICVCKRCGNRLYPPLGRFFLDHDAARRFFTERGRSMSSTPFWELEFCVTDDVVYSRRSEPWRCTLEIGADGDTLVLLIDDDLSVQSSAVS